MISEDNIQRFLEDNSDLLETDDIGQLYKRWSPFDNSGNGYRAYGEIYIHSLTEYFLLNDINPLDYVTRVPEYFAAELKLDDNVKKIDIDNHITAVQNYAFMGSIGCFGNVDLSNVKVFGTAAFSKSDLSGDITLGARIIPVWAFQEVDLDTVTLTNSCKEIESYAFLGSNIKKLYLPDSLTKIDIDAFIDATVNIYCSHALYNSLLKSKRLARGSTVEIIFTD